MDFFVYDNIYKYNDRVPYDGSPINRLYVSQIQIPKNNAFWFETDYNKEERNVNIHKKYVHFHPGMAHSKNMQFDEIPHVVKQSELKYNPKTKNVEIVIPRSFFRKKTIFKKKCTYYGSEVPKKSIMILGEVIYDMGLDKMNFILNYFPTNKIRFHTEEYSEPATVEQFARVNELERQISEIEEQLK